RDDSAGRDQARCAVEPPRSALSARAPAQGELRSRISIGTVRRGRSSPASPSGRRRARNGAGPMTIAVGYQPHLGNSPNNSSFYLALRVLPAAKREAMYSVYAFCRAVDDVADSDTDPERRLTVLARWREEIDHLYGRERHSRLETLRNAIVRFGLERRDFLAIIDGMEMDVRGELWAPDWPQLELYCDRVASAVGRLSVRIFGLDDD